MNEEDMRMFWSNSVIGMKGKLRNMFQIHFYFAWRDRGRPTESLSHVRCQRPTFETRSSSVYFTYFTTKIMYSVMKTLSTQRTKFE